MASPTSQKVSSFRTALSYFNAQLDPLRRQFVEDFLQRQVDVTYRLGLTVFFWFHLSSIVIDSLILDKLYSIQVLRYTHIASVTAYLLFTRTHWFGRPQHIIKDLLLQFFSLIGYAELVRYYSSNSAELDITIMRAWSGFLLVGIFQIMYWPGFSPRARILMSSMSILYAVYAWHQSPYLKMVLPIAIFSFVVATFAQIVATTRTISSALDEYEIKELRAQMERAQVEAEMTMARRIHDSMSMPELTEIGRFRLHTYHRSHNSVGGDWSAARTDREGHLYLLIADAAGKGMQAALVVHAVQSLWAEELERENFDPPAWLQRINAVLWRMGRGEEHMVTMGIAKIEKTRATYWSAGHLPFFIVAYDSERRETVLRLHRPGNPLGIEQQCLIEQSTSDLPNDCELHFICATDGVFQNARSMTPKSIAEVTSRLISVGPQALDEFPAVDDKTVMWVENKRAA